MIVRMVVNLLGKKDLTYLKRVVLLGLIMGVSISTWCASPVHGEEELSFSGITEPIRDVELSLSVEGRISKVFFKEGDHIKKGQHILELDKKFEELEVERRKLIWESKAELVAAKARVLLLKSQMETSQKLFESAEGISKEKLEEKELEYRLSVAEQNRLEIEEERQRIEYEMAIENLQKRTLESPIEGVIIKLLLDEGEGCEAVQPLVHLVDTRKSLFVCNVEEKIGRTLKNGQSVDLKIQAGAGFIVKQGTITFVSPVVDSASSLLEVKTEFDNQDGAVRPGISGLMLLKSPITAISKK